MVRFVTHSTPAGHHYDAVDRLASRFARKRRSQRARAGLSSLLCKGCGAALGLRASSSGAHREPHDLAASSRKSLTLAGAANERSGRPADRPTPKSAAGRRKCTHTSRRERHAAPRARDRAPHPPRPPAAVPQDLPHEADAREEDGPEPAHPPVDPHAHGQQDPLELEAAALAPHEARLVSLLKKTCSS